MSDSHQATILIVDDMPENIQVLAACLKDKYTIKVATSGEKAMSIIEDSENIDLILLDIELPGQSGYDVCKLLKANLTTKDIPIIFITSRDQDSEEEKGFLLGAVDYITKPVKPIIVQARVNTHVTLKQQRDRLMSIATVDQLTAVYNRHYLFDVGDKIISTSKRHGTALSLMILDLDFFKSINDTHGHIVGDKVLAELGMLLKSTARKSDIVARFGGEEFVVLLEHCNVADAREHAEKIRTTLTKQPLGGQLVTCSIGVAELSSTTSNMNALINNADSALYRAKAKGRNNVQVFE